MINQLEKKRILQAIKDNNDFYFTLPIEQQEELEIFLMASRGAKYSSKKVPLPSKYKNADSATVNSMLQHNGLLLKEFPQYNTYESMVMVAVDESSEALEFADNKFKSDRQFIEKLMKCSNIYYHVFQHVDPVLRADKDFVLRIMKNPKYSHILTYLSEDLKKDMDVVMTALDSERHAIEYVSDELKADPKFIKIIKGRYKKDLLRYVNKKWGDDKDFVLEAVKNQGYQILYASDRLKQDREITLEAISSDEYAFLYIASDFKNDRSLLLEALPRNPRLLKSVSDKFKDDIDLVLKTVNSNGHFLCYASDRLKNNKEVVLTAIKNEPKSIVEASSLLQNDVNLCMEAVTKKGVVFQYLSDEMKDNKEIVLTALQSSSAMYEYVSPRLKNDEEIINGVFEKNAAMFKFMPKEFRGIKENLLNAMSRNGLAIKYATLEHKNDPHIVLLALTQNEKAIEHIGKDLKKMIGRSNPLKAINALILNEKLHNEIPEKSKGLMNKAKI